MDFVDFNLAKKLKEKGFKEKCIAYYWEKINEHTASFVVLDDMPDDGVCILDLISEHNKSEWSPFIDAPTISKVLKWLREEKKYHVYAAYGAVSKFRYVIIQLDNEDAKYTIKRHFKTYEDAIMAGINYVINNII